MNDKQKQIEEMAHKLCKSKSPCIECLKRSRDAGIFVNKTDCECYLHAKILHKHYQPKLPEGSEVVDRKVLEMFQKDEERFREKAKFYYEKCKSYGIDNFYDPELEEVDD